MRNSYSIAGNDRVAAQIWRDPYPCGNSPQQQSHGDPELPQTQKVTLRDRGYRLGIVANQPLGSEARLAGFGLRDCFEVICASDEEGVAKPDPEIFRRAITRAGCNPAESVMIGDRTDNDIAPAKALGMQTVLIRQGYGGYHVVHSPEEAPDETVDTLTELLPLFP